MAKRNFKYGVQFEQGATALEIEMTCIRKGVGNGLAFHYEQMRRLLWPNLDSHRWHELCLKEIRRPNAKLTVLMGPGSSGKTHEAAWNYLCEYFVFPEETCVLVCSTDIRGLKKRVWAEMSMLWQEAKDQYSWLPGYYLESSLAITTENLEDVGVDKRKVRDMRKGLYGVPCEEEDQYRALRTFIGIKSPRMRLIADEASLMGPSFLKSFSNLNNNPDFQAIVLGNPNDILDPLGRAAEPVGGWSDHMEPSKTEVWDTSFFGGRCVNLIGTDSPNFDGPPDEPPKYPYLISRRNIEQTEKAFGKQSFEYYSQCVGCMKIAGMTKRVISADLCRKCGAHDDVVWLDNEPRVKISALDAAYGGDRCVTGHGEFGRDISGAIVINVFPPVIIPVSANSDNPEDEIAVWVREYNQRYGIPPENFFHDSTGRGSLGTAVARAWSAMCNPVEFGGPPTARPVCQDMWITDEETGARRLKRCDEHYSKFVTELWFTVRYTVEAKQMRNLPRDVMEEGCKRTWRIVRGNRYEIETKQEMKERTGQSPDLFDWLSILVEGARRRGFQIARLENSETVVQGTDWLREMRTKSRQFRRSTELVEV